MKYLLLRELCSVWLIWRQREEKLWIAFLRQIRLPPHFTIPCCSDCLIGLNVFPSSRPLSPRSHKIGLIQHIYYIKLGRRTFWNLLPCRRGGMFSLTGENSKYIGFFVPGSESLNWSLFGSWPLLWKGIESFVDKMWASGTLHPGLKRFRRWKVIMTDFQWSPSNCVTQTFNQTSYCSIIFCCLCVSMYGNTFWWIVTA